MDIQKSASKNNPNLIDCMNCYRQYSLNKSFNYDCPFYDKAYSKCPWIDVIDKELDIYLENQCNEGLIKKLLE